MLRRSYNTGGTLVKRSLLAAALLSSAVLVNAADDSKVTFVSHEQVAKGGSLATAPSYSVTVVHRDKAGVVEVHDKETDTFYVLDGAATIVTGGSMVGGACGTTAGPGCGTTTAPEAPALPTGGRR